MRQKGQERTLDVGRSVPVKMRVKKNNVWRSGGGAEGHRPLLRLGTDAIVDVIVDTDEVGDRLHVYCAAAHEFHHQVPVQPQVPADVLHLLDLSEGDLRELVAAPPARDADPAARDLIPHPELSDDASGEGDEADDEDAPESRNDHLRRGWF